MTNNLLLVNFQSGFKSHKDPETLVKVSTDLMVAADKAHNSILILIDLNLAFDSMDQHVLTCHLQNYVGINDLAVDWFISYPSNRSFSVKLTPPPLVLLLFAGSPMVLPWAPFWFHLLAAS